MSDKPEYVIATAAAPDVTAGRRYRVFRWSSTDRPIVIDDAGDYHALIRWTPAPTEAPAEPATPPEYVIATAADVDVTEGELYEVADWRHACPVVITKSGGLRLLRHWRGVTTATKSPAPVETPAEPAPSGSVAHAILTEAAGIVQGARNATHGDKERSFAAIADLWNAYLDNRAGGQEAPISPRDVASLMVLLKLARSIQGQAVRDHFVDAAGYAAIAGEMA